MKHRGGGNIRYMCVLVEVGSRCLSVGGSLKDSQAVSRAPYVGLYSDGHTPNHPRVWVRC